MSYLLVIVRWTVALGAVVVLVSALFVMSEREYVVCDDSGGVMRDGLCERNADERLEDGRGQAAGREEHEDSDRGTQASRR